MPRAFTYSTTGNNAHMHSYRNYYICACTCTCTMAFSPGGVAPRAHLLAGIASIMPILFNLYNVTLSAVFLFSYLLSTFKSFKYMYLLQHPKGHNVVLSLTPKGTSIGPKGTVPFSTVCMPSEEHRCTVY